MKQGLKKSSGAAATGRTSSKRKSDGRTNNGRHDLSAKGNKGFKKRAAIKLLQPVTAVVKEHKKSMVELEAEFKEKMEEVEMDKWEATDTIAQLEDDAAAKAKKKARNEKAQPKRKRTRTMMEHGENKEQRRKQVLRLREKVKELFDDDVSDEYRASQLVALVLDSDEGKEALLASEFMERHNKEQQQEVADIIQGHFNTVGIVAKHAKTLSWGTWEDLRKIFGFEFEPPEDETYSTEGDIGKYYRLELPNGVKVPVLPSKYKIKKQEEIIVNNQGGYTKVKHGDGFTVDWIARVREEIELKSAEFWEKRGCELQVFGDAFRLMAQCKGVNTGARVIGARRAGGHKNTIKTMVVWEGGDDYKQVKAKMHIAIKALNEIKKNGYINTKYGEVKVTIVGGGDMLWINDCLGLGGFAGRFKCSWCECDGDELGGTGAGCTKLAR